METVRALTDEQITAPVDEQHWSVKDHLAHLTAWEAGMVALLKKENRWESMGLEPRFVENTEGYDAINARLYERHKDEPLDEVLTRFNDTHGQLADAVRDAGDEGIHMSYSIYAPGETGDDSGDPVLNWLIGNSYGHYAEHLMWIKERIAEQGW
jgi:hypothetical protein